MVHRREPLEWKLGKQGSQTTWRPVLLGLVWLLLLEAPLFADETAMRKAATPSGQIQWIDVHVHLVGGRGRMAVDYEGAAQAALAAMDEAGIQASVIMPTPQAAGFPLPYDCESFLSALKQSPGRFAFLGGGGSLNVLLQEAARTGKVDEGLARNFEERANQILAQGAAGFGEIAAHHYSILGPGHPYESVPADHPLLLLLADMAARHRVVIDLHFDPVVTDTALPPRLSTPPNPPVLHANVAAFERLLAHNRNATIVWAHAGSDILGHWTVALSRELLQKHPNLYMSLRVFGGNPTNRVFNEAGDVKPEWLTLLSEFPDRFVIGGDQFIASPRMRGQGPGLVAAQKAQVSRDGSRTLLSKLPGPLARKIGYENALRLYKLKE